LDFAIFSLKAGTMSEYACVDANTEWMMNQAVHQQQLAQIQPTHPAAQSVQSLTLSVNSIANSVSSLSPTNTNASLRYPTLYVPQTVNEALQMPLTFNAYPVPATTNAPQQQQYMENAQYGYGQQGQTQQHQPQTHQYMHPHTQLYAQMHGIRSMVHEEDDGYSPLTPQITDESKSSPDKPPQQKRTYTKRKDSCTTPKPKDPPKEGSRLYKQHEEIETMKRTLRDPLLLLIQTIERIIPAVATYPNSDPNYLAHYLPSGTDASKSGMQQQNRNPVLPYVFYKSMEEEMLRLIPETVKTCTDALTKYINKYRHRHVNNRRKHLSTDLQVSNFEKSPAQLALEATDKAVLAPVPLEQPQPNESKAESKSATTAVVSSSKEKEKEAVKEIIKEVEIAAIVLPKDESLPATEAEEKQNQTTRKRRRCAMK
jgi:hypothetical protein